MQKRLLVVLALLGGLAGIVLLVLLAGMSPPERSIEVVPRPPEQVAAPVQPEQTAKPQSGTLMGRVLKGDTDEGIAGATVIPLKPHLEPPKEGEVARWGDLKEAGRVYTDLQGNFRIADLPPDYWNLWVEKNGYAWSTVPRAKFDELHQIRLYPAARVHGRVVYPDDTPAEGVRIEYHIQGTHSEVLSHYCLDKFHTTTKADGSFAYENLPPGKFTIEVYADDYLPAPWKFEPPLRPGDDRDLGKHKLEGGFGMTVRVLWLGTNEGVPDVEVVVRPVGDPMPRTKTGQRRNTDAQGVARFQGLGGQVMEKPKFLVAANVEGVGPVLPDSGGMQDPDSDITIYLRKDGVVKGKVQRPNGQPLEHFFCELEAQGHIERQLRSWGKDGEFNLYQVPEGPYTLWIRYGNLIDVSVPVTVKGGEEVDVGTITLREGGEVYGMVRRASGKELEGVVRVNLGRKVKSATGQDVWDVVGRAYCLKDGSYTIKGLPAGDFFVWPESYAEPSSTTDPVAVSVPSTGSAVQRDLLIYGEGFLNLKFMDMVKGQPTHVHAPKVSLIETASGQEIAWISEGQRLRPGRYEVYVDLKDADGALKRYKVLETDVREVAHRGQGTEGLDPIEIRLYEIREHGGETEPGGD